MVLRAVIYILLFIVSIILQSTLFHYLDIAGTKPDLLLVIIVLLAILRGEKSGALIGFVYGFLEDLIIGNYFGMQALIKMTTGFIVGKLHGKIFQDNLATPLIAAAVGTVTHDLLYIMVRGLAGFGFFGTNVLIFIFLSTFYNVCIAFIIYGKFYTSATSGYLKVPR